MDTPNKTLQQIEYERMKRGKEVYREMLDSLLLEKREKDAGAFQFFVNERTHKHLENEMLIQRLKELNKEILST